MDHELRKNMPRTSHVRQAKMTKKFLYWTGTTEIRMIGMSRLKKYKAKGRTLAK